MVHTSLKIHKETDKGKAKDAKDEKSTLLKKYVFLEDNDKGTPTLINKWQTKQVEDDKHSKDQFMSDLRSAAMLACSAMQQTPLTTNDILIIRRELASQPMKKVIEIWTLQKFKKYTLVLTPYKCEIKERYWTLGRSVLIKNEEMNKSKKHLALDGRLTSRVPDDDGKDKDKTFNLFFAIERSEDKSKCNLKLKWTTTSITTDVGPVVGNKRKFDNVTQVLEMPYLINETDIPEHTKLIAEDDVQLHKIAKTV